MFFDLRCIPCIIHQAYHTVRLFNKDDQEVQLKILKEVCKVVDTIDRNYTTPQFSVTIQSILEKNLGMANPFERIKEENRRKVEKFIPFLREMTEGSRDRLDTAIRIAIIGNIIDLGINSRFDIEYEINRIVSNEIDLSLLPGFKKDLEKAEQILYIGDNYEEALFDKFLLHELASRNVVFAVRSKSVLNDITLADAKRIGIDKICQVLESGSKIAGTDLKQGNPEFLDLYQNADMVIAKGQGNFETLIKETRPIYFLFKVKCEVIAEHSGYPVGKGALLYNKSLNNRNRLNKQ